LGDGGQYEGLAGEGIHDRVGHIAGDDVLRAVARRLAERVRPEDAVYRFGGEEFVVLIKVARTSNAVAAADRLRIAIEGLHLAHPGNEPFGSVTVSAGISVVGPDDLEADDDAWIARSDAALYRAKENGRNRSAT
jgi:diguanylate cyclase (GGDEF)-like protein